MLGVCRSVRRYPIGPGVQNLALCLSSFVRTRSSHHSAHTIRSGSDEPKPQPQRFVAQDPAFRERIRASFSRMGATRSIGFELSRIEEGEVEVGLVHSDRGTQQHGFMHAGTTTMGMDTACGYACASLMPADSGVLTININVNLLAPCIGERYRFIGRVRKAGRQVIVAEGEALAVDKHGKEKLVATMTATNMTIVGRHDVKG